MARKKKKSPVISRIILERDLLTYAYLRAEEDAENRKLGEHTLVLNELYGSPFVFNSTSLSWYRPV